MEVTHIEPLTKTRFRVFLDGQFAFVLYKGELSRYSIAEGKEITEEVCQTIKNEVVLKRAKLRAMHLLNDMDRTESQLCRKLTEGGYTQDIVEQALDYVKSFGYVNDENYARRLVENKKDSKSRKEIYALLRKKGLSGELAEKTLSGYYEPEDSKAAILEIMRKRHYDPDTATEKEKQKMYGCLMRKGFRYEDIRHLIQVSEWNA